MQGDNPQAGVGRHLRGVVYDPQDETTRPSATWESRLAGSDHNDRVGGDVMAGPDRTLAVVPDAQSEVRPRIDAARQVLTRVDELGPELCIGFALELLIRAADALPIREVS